jgi:hypothetical protein
MHLFQVREIVEEQVVAHLLAAVQAAVVLVQLVRLAQRITKHVPQGEMGYQIQLLVDQPYFTRVAALVEHQVQPPQQQRAGLVVAEPRGMV